MAPARFLEEAASENVLAGVPMLRRAQFMYGQRLPRGPRGHVDTGLGKAPARRIGRPRGPDRSRRQDADRARARRRALRVPVHARVRSARGDDLLPAGEEGVLRRRDRQSHDAQPLHAARREGARRAALERLHRRGARALRRRRGGVREPQLADLGQRADRRLPREAARRLQVHPRPDAAARERGRDAARDRRAARAAELAAAVVREPRLLRHRAPQREGRLPVVLRLVRRATPRTSTRCRPPRRARSTSSSWAARPRCSRRRRPRTTRATTAGPPPCSTTSCSREPDNAAARELLARCYDQLGYRAESGPWRDVYLSGAYELRHGEPTRDGAGSPARRSCCATRRSSASSTRWRRASTGPRPTA